jgi:hypothetical protein
MNSLMHARRRPGECIRFGPVAVALLTRPHACLFTEKHPQRFGRDRTPPKTEKNGGPWTGGLIQDCDWLPISIETDRLVRGIIPTALSFDLCLFSGSRR